MKERLFFFEKKKQKTFFILALWLGQITVAFAGCEMHRAALLPLTLWQQKLFVPVSVNGSQEFFFVDTGASITTVAKSTADALTLPRDFDHTADMFGVGGKESHLYIAQLATLGLGPITVQNFNAPIAKFSQVMADLATPVGGLIGADILSHFDVEIDIPHRQLALWRVAGCTAIKPDFTGAFTAVPMQIAPSHHVTVSVKIDDVPVDLLIDTGSPGLALSTHSAARAGASPEMLEESRPLHGRGVNDREVDGWLHIFQRVEVGGQVFGDVRTWVVDNGRIKSWDGLLGLQFLKRGRVWISYSTGVFFIEGT